MTELFGTRRSVTAQMLDQPTTTLSAKEVPYMTDRNQAEEEACGNQA